MEKNPRKIQKGKSLIKWQNQKLKQIKQLDNNYLIPNLEQVLNSEEISKKKVPNQMANSKAQILQTNGLQLSYS